MSTKTAEVGRADADYVLRWLQQSKAPANIVELQERALETICSLLAEREFGPQPWACANTACPVITCGDGYAVCPRCGDPLVATQTPERA